MYSITELNTNPIFTPPDFLLNPEYNFFEIDCDDLEFPNLMKEHPTAKMLKEFIENPYILYNHTEQIMGTRLFHLNHIKDKPDNVFDSIGQTFEWDNPTHRQLYEKYANEFDKLRVENRMKNLYDGNPKQYDSTSYTLKIGKGWTTTSFNVELTTFGTWKKGTSLKIATKYDYRTEKENSFLSNHYNCFNIITKQFKLMEEKKRSFYKKYFTNKAFTAFEECGIEVLYARKGYAIDGKRLPSFNRGSVYGLKSSLRQNKIKQKGLSKKDDIIKALLKI